MTVQKRATLHEKTVQKVARNEINKKDWTPPYMGASPLPHGPVHTHLVDPTLWKYAKETIRSKDNSYTEIKIISTTEVVLT